MSKDKLFSYYLKKNPSLASQLENGKITLTTSGFKKFFNTTYEEGYKQGFNQEPSVDEFDDECMQPQGMSASVQDLLNIFGMR